MPSCLLVLCWPDFQGELATATAHALAASRIRHHLDHRFRKATAFAWAHPYPGSVCTWGLAPLASEPTPALLEDLLLDCSDATRVILAMAPGRAAGLLESRPELREDVELWIPEATAEERLEDGYAGGVRPMSHLLGLKTAHSVGLLVDTVRVENCLQTTGQAPLPAPWRSLLMRRAELVGPVVTARFYEEAGCGYQEHAGKREHESTEESAWHEGALQPDLETLLGSADGPDTWIVAADHPEIPRAVEYARRHGRRLLVWPPGPELLPAEARSLADGCTPLRSVLSHGPEPEWITRDFADAPRTTPRGGVTTQIRSLTVREAELPRDNPAQQPVLPGSRLGPWVRLIYHTECLLRRNRWSKVAFRKLSAALAEMEEFGPTSANALMWLNRAKAEGMLLVDQEVHRADPSIRVTVCRPNPEHPISRAAVEVPDRCLRLLYQMLQKMPWVSFKLLRSVLLREQWLGGPPHQLDEAAIDEWLNFLIHDTAIDMRKEPNLANPDFPVTALRLSDHHPLSRNVAAEAVEGSRLAAERAILAVDHFLTRNRKPWMAMTALRRALDGMGREELQEVLQGLQKLGALITESYPNPQKEHFTTGCRLGPDQPLVLDALRTRNAIIRATQYHQRFRSWVPLARVEEELGTEHWRAASPAHRIAWFLLLRDEGILELDQDGLLADATWKNARCRLNVADAVVRTVVAEHLGELTEPAPEVRAQA